jgi:hypothetical protein
MFANIILAIALFANAELMEQNPPSHLSTAQKFAETRPLVRAATECIIKAVLNDPRINVTSPSETNKLIVKAVGECKTPARAMIDSYDKFFGDGAGEAFFMGPYLDILPKAVQDARKKIPGPPP